MGNQTLSVADVAARYVINASTVLRWCARGIITYHCLRGRSGRRRHIWFGFEELISFETEHLVSSSATVATPDEAAIKDGVMLLTPRDVAEVYGVHLTTVIRWCARGEIDHLDFSIRSGGKRTIRFHQRHLDTFNAASRVKARPVLTSRMTQSVAQR